MIIGYLDPWGIIRVVVEYIEVSLLTGKQPNLGILYMHNTRQLGVPLKDLQWSMADMIGNGTMLPKQNNNSSVRFLSKSADSVQLLKKTQQVPGPQRLRNSQQLISP